MVHTTHSSLGEAATLHDQFVGDLAMPAVWEALMRSAGVHTRYAPVNQMMITAQRPGASDVRPRSEWEEMGHQVLDGEQGIKIFVSTDSAWGPERQAFPPECEPVCWESRLEECSSCIGHYDVAEVWDVRQTTAADSVWHVPSPWPVDFIERRAVRHLEMIGVRAAASETPTRQTALARLCDLARAQGRFHDWPTGDDDRAGGGDRVEVMALSTAFVVARLAGMRGGCGPAPVPTLLPEAAGCNSPMKVAATKVIRAAQELNRLLFEPCPCCGELA